MHHMTEGHGNSSSGIAGSSSKTSGGSASKATGLRDQHQGREESDFSLLQCLAAATRTYQLPQNAADRDNTRFESHIQNGKNWACFSAAHQPLSRCIAVVAVCCCWQAMNKSMYLANAVPGRFAPSLNISVALSCWSHAQKALPSGGPCHAAVARRHSSPGSA